MANWGHRLSGLLRSPLFRPRSSRRVVDRCNQADFAQSTGNVTKSLSSRPFVDDGFASRITYFCSNVLHGNGSSPSLLRRVPKLAADCQRSQSITRQLQQAGQCYSGSAASCRVDHKPSGATGRQMPALGEVFSESAPFGEDELAFETGKLARFADGAVVAGYKDTKILCTAVCGRNPMPGAGFHPLTVDYREKQYAQGKIPSTFLRREGAPQEREVLCSRLVDRAVRPLFPEGFYHETQILTNVLSSDGTQDPDVLAINAASTALMISDIPWAGPIGAVRIGRLNGKLVVNPDLDELSQSDLSLVYAGTADRTVMMDVQAREIPEADLAEALRLAHAEAGKLLEPQLRLAKKVNFAKRDVKLETANPEVMERVEAMAGQEMAAILEDPSYTKQKRGAALAQLEEALKDRLRAAGEDDIIKDISRAFEEVKWTMVRRNILEKGLRPDHRQLDEVRELFCEVEPFRTLHGSSLFNRGNTQVVCTVTMGGVDDAQRLDSLSGPPRKRFMVHYSFPPFATNEVKRLASVNRREVGHGTLAEKALLALLPPEEEFNFTVRVTSECLASDGSSSMATVCGGSLALMDAGVPLKKHVAGVSIGLVTDFDEATQEVKDYRLLTDIVGLEDHLGDMDFKVAGTRDGVTAIQLDIKPAGIPLDILIEGLSHARKARCHIIDFMEGAIAEPRKQAKASAPRQGTTMIESEFIGKLIGPGGSMIRSIQDKTGSRISVENDGTVTIFAREQAGYDQALQMIEDLVGRELEVGKTYSGTVQAVRDFGAFVEIEGAGGQTGLLHISELAHYRVNKVEDIVNVGDVLEVACIGRDVRGNVKLSRKALLPRASDDFSTSRPPNSATSGEEPSTSRSPAEEFVIGQTYTGTVQNIRDYGAFIDFTGPGDISTGLLHISELAHHRVSRVADLLSVGDCIQVVVIGKDHRGNVKLSRKALLPPPSSKFGTPGTLPEDSAEGPHERIGSAPPGWQPKGEVQKPSSTDRELVEGSAYSARVVESRPEGLYLVLEDGQRGFVSLAGDQVNCSVTSSNTANEDWCPNSNLSRLYGIWQTGDKSLSVGEFAEFPFSGRSSTDGTLLFDLPGGSAPDMLDQVTSTSQDKTPRGPQGSHEITKEKDQTLSKRTRKRRAGPDEEEDKGDSSETSPPTKGRNKKGQSSKKVAAPVEEWKLPVEEEKVVGL